MGCVRQHSHLFFCSMAKQKCQFNSNAAAPKVDEERQTNHAHHKTSCLAHGISVVVPAPASLMVTFCKPTGPMYIAVATVITVSPLPAVGAFHVTSAVFALD